MYIVELPTALADQEEAHLLLEHCTKRELQIDEEINNKIQSNIDLNAKLLSFHEKLESLWNILSVLQILCYTIRATLAHTLFTEAHTLRTTITDTCTLAESVSHKVRDLDVIKALVQQTNKKVEDIIDLKHCADIVKKAMTNEDYETAAEHIQKYMGFTTALGNSQSIMEGVDASREAHTHEAITNADLQLKTIIRNRLEQSLAQDNQESIMRFCELYAKLGLRDEGLTRYCHYLRKLCCDNAERMTKLYLYGSGRLTTPAPNEPALSAPIAITKVFEYVAVIIEEQVPVVDAHFGAGSSIIMIRNMVEQCNTHTNRLVELFMENHAVVRKMDFITDRGRIAEKDRDPRVLPATLDEMVSICKSAEFYMRFISKKVLVLPLPIHTVPYNGKPIMGLSSSPQQTGQNQVKRITNTEVAISMNSELCRKVQEMISFYISLEEYFMVESVQKAIKMDELSEDNLTSIMVDYVFFVLQHSSQRAVETHNVQGLCAILNHVVRCLDNYREVLIKSFKEFAAKALAGRLPDNKWLHLIMLNNMDVSSEYILRLKSEIEAKACAPKSGVATSNSSSHNNNNSFMFTNVEDRDKIKPAITDLLEISKRFKQALEMNMKQFCASLQPRTKALIDLFANVTYEITDQEYASNEINDPFAQIFISEVTQVLKPYSTHFTPSNYDLFIHLLVTLIVEKFEKVLMQKRVNQLGALQFDKDLMTLSAHFASITIQSVRDKFARLSQMANLLTTDHIHEVNEIWGEHSGKITWRLTPTEVRKVLMLRVDYSPDQIIKLKL